jgi:type IV pilus assembly protein PilX
MNITSAHTTVSGRRERGAALVIGLILLLILTILAVSGVVTSTSELRMVANQQQQERAFQAAEVAIERALTTSIASTSTTTTVARTEITPGADDTEEYEYRLRPVGEFQPPASAPTGAFSAGVGLAAFHFEVTSSGFAPGDAVSDHTQGFYVIVNTGGTTLPSTTGLP